VLFQQRQHARRVGDIADIDGLPGRAEHNASGRFVPSMQGTTDASRREGLDKGTSIQGRWMSHGFDPSSHLDTTGVALSYRVDR
jgi:hypothetical protein